MDLVEFRRHAHDVVDWMADYLETIEQHPVRAQVKPGEIDSKLARVPPEQGEEMGQIPVLPTGSIPASSPISRPIQARRRSWQR
jgi:hypothetical protein